MATAPLTPYRTAAVPGLAAEGEELAAALDEIGVRAIDLAHTVAPGFHGRRRAGIGDSFWEYRRFAEGDHAHQIDWRRSARHEEGHLFVREKEWETAQTVWLWTDLSASMGFQSELAPTRKGERGLLLMLALAQLLVSAGERVALPGVMSPSAHRRASRLMAEFLEADYSDLSGDRFPEPETLTARSTCVIFSDFLDPIDEMAGPLGEIAEMGITLHFVEITDPAEETLPYSGRTEFRAAEGGPPFIAGKAETLRAAYGEALAAHRNAFAALAQGMGASLLHHRTDHSAETALLALAAHVADEHELEFDTPEAVLAAQDAEAMR